MRKVKSILTVLVLAGASVPAFCYAEFISLGDISEAEFSGRIPAKITLGIAGNDYDLPKTNILSWLREETELSYDSKYRSEIENTDFCSYKKSLSCKLSFSSQDQNHIRKVSSLSADKDAIVKFIDELAEKTKKDPENARLKMEDGRVSVFSLSSSGQNLDAPSSVETLEKYLTSENYPGKIELPYKETRPEISTDSIDNLGITSLIGEGVSNFAGSPKNRILNIKVAVKRFEGLLIKPGEEFSFVGNLGEVDAEHGYYPELVIKKDKTEPEFGGGVCQVSTTVFRAAINAGLEITARRNHAYPVGYYNPQGMDATVYVPRPDLRFINNTPSYILIEPRIEGNQLIFDFYGTDDGRKVEVIGPKILERNPDGSMKTTFTQQVYGKDGKLAREDVFNSSYDSPSKYPHPSTSEDLLTEKPKDWSQKEWDIYKKAHNL